MKRTLLAAAAAVTVLLPTGPADAKVLPYDLDVSPVRVTTGQPVEFVLTPHPDNFLGHELQVEVYAARDLGRDGLPRPGSRALRSVVLRPSAETIPDEHGPYASGPYSGTFATGAPGDYVVLFPWGAGIDQPGYPDPAAFTVAAPDRLQPKDRDESTSMRGPEGSAVLAGAGMTALAVAGIAARVRSRRRAVR